MNNTELLHSAYSACVGFDGVKFVIWGYGSGDTEDEAENSAEDNSKDWHIDAQYPVRATCTTIAISKREFNSIKSGKKDPTDFKNFDERDHELDSAQIQDIKEQPAYITLSGRDFVSESKRHISAIVHWVAAVEAGLRRDFPELEFKVTTYPPGLAGGHHVEASGLVLESRIRILIVNEWHLYLTRLGDPEFIGNK